MRIAAVSAITATCLVAAFGLLGCAGDKPQDVQEKIDVVETTEPINEESHPVDEASQPDEPSFTLSSNIIGVWESNSVYFAFDGEVFFSPEGLFFPYTTDDETSTLYTVDTGESFTVTFIDQDTMDFADGRFTRVEGDPAEFIEQNHVVLAPGESWSNDALSIEVYSFGYTDGDIPLHDGRVIYNDEPCFYVDCDITNLSDDLLLSSFFFIVNDKTAATGGIIGGSGLNPFESEDVQFTYGIADGTRDSITSLELVFRYHTDDGTDVIPAITIVQE